MRDTGKITVKKQRVITALMTAPTVRDAADQAGVSEATVYRWMREDDFHGAYKAALDAATKQAATHLQSMLTAAAQTLHEIMLDTAAAPSARVSAARAVWEIAYRAREIDDFSERLRKVEERLMYEPKSH